MKLVLKGVRFRLLLALPKLDELILVCEDDGLYLATDDTMWWNEGSEITFVEPSAKEKEEDRIGLSGL
jgi:hypothetical protein